MNITIEEQNGLKIIRFGGRLDSNTTGEIYDDMVELAQNNQKLIANLAGLEYMSSAGLRVILLAAKLMKPRRGELIICEPNKMVREVLEVSGFNSLIHIYATEEHAVKHFQDS